MGKVGIGSDLLEATLDVRGTVYMDSGGADIKLTDGTSYIDMSGGNIDISGEQILISDSSANAYIDMSGGNIDISGADVTITGYSGSSLNLRGPTINIGSKDPPSNIKVLGTLSVPDSAILLKDPSGSQLTNHLKK